MGVECPLLGYFANGPWGVLPALQVAHLDFRWSPSPSGTDFTAIATGNNTGYPLEVAPEPAPAALPGPGGLGERGGILLRRRGRRSG